MKLVLSVRNMCELFLPVPQSLSLSRPVYCINVIIKKELQLKALALVNEDRRLKQLTNIQWQFNVWIMTQYIIED